MAENFYTILTKIGRSKISNSAVSGSKVNFKTLKLGDGNGAYYEPSENQTSLIKEVWSGNINSISVDDANTNWIIVETVIPATDGGFFIREAGIFDEAGDMIAVGKLSETYKPVVSEGSTKDLIIKIVLEVSNTNGVALKIDPNVVIATKNDIQVLESKFNDIDAQLSDMANKKADNTDNTRTTTAKDVTGAINELNSSKAKDTDSTRKTTAKTVTGAINELSDNKIDKSDFVSKSSYAVTTGTSTAYAVTTTPTPTVYIDGMQITIMPHVDCGANPTLNWNSLGALTIVNQDGSATNAGDILANKPLSLVRVGSSFFICNSSGKTFFDRIYSSNPWKYIGVGCPVQLMNSSAVVYNDKIYVVGNYSPSLTNMYIYDIKTNKWSVGGSLPLNGIYDVVSEVYNGKIYIMGGHVSSTFLDTVYIYDIATNTITNGMKIPTKLFGAISTIANGKIYIMGGRIDASTYSSALYIYDIATNIWTTGASKTLNNITIARCTYYNGKIYVTDSMSLYIYDIATNIWTSGANSLEVCESGLLEAYNGKIYTSHYSARPSTLVYTIATNTWSATYAMPYIKSYIVSVLNEDKIFALGTNISDDYPNVTEICVLK